MVLYILADLISFLEIQRSQIAGSSSTVFAVNLITCCNAYQLHSNRTQNQLSIYVFSRNATVNIAVKFYKKWLPTKNWDVAVSQATIGLARGEIQSALIQDKSYKSNVTNRPLKDLFKKKICKKHRKKLCRNSCA